MDRRARHAGHRGFTLIENIISLFLITFVLVGGMHLYNYAKQLVVMVEHKKIAAEIVNAAMESLKSSGYLNLPPAGSPVITNVGVGSFSGEQTVTVSDIDDPVDSIVDYKEVHVQLTWTDTGKQTGRSLEATTYIEP